MGDAAVGKSDTRPLWLIVLADGIPCVQTIHNELDYRLPVTEGLAAFNILQARKVPSKLLVFPDENHVRWPRFFHFPRPRGMLLLTHTSGC